MFKFHLISDTFFSSGILEAKQRITNNQLHKIIESEIYGDDLNGIVICLMCCDPDIIFKRRLRFSKKEKVLYMDIILNHDQFSVMSHEQRISEICKILLEKIPLIFKKYKFNNFNSSKLMKNLEDWFLNNNFIK